MLSCNLGEPSLSELVAYTENLPFFDTEFAENPEPRCPCVLLLDNSGSMMGNPIKHLNLGLQTFKDQLLTDELASKRVEVAIVTFGPIRIQNDFVTAADFQAPNLSAEADTPMGAAIEEGIRLLNQRKQVYKANGVSYYRPWIFLITDGAPTDDWQRAAKLIKEGEEQGSFSFFAVGVENANLGLLSKIATREPLKLRGLDFRELFMWLSSSMRSVSQSSPGDIVPLQSPAGWAVV
jgi:uncharacterized protein YegL